MAKIEAMTFEEASPAEVERLMQSDKWVAELKLDGVRCLARVVDGDVTLMNRKGAPLRAASTNAHRAAIEMELALAFEAGEWVLDGEIMDDGRYWLFDILRSDGGRITDERDPLHRRRFVLEATAAIAGWDDDSLIRVVTQATTEEDKRMLLDSTQRVGGEGIMLKYVDAPYIPKRVRTGLKVKLTKTVDAFILARDTDGHTNATLAVCDGDRVVEIGACSMIGKADAQVGDVVEVQYLYVGAGGRLYQPRMMRVRDDKTPTECLLSQLDGCGVNRAVAG